jgi:selenocysteine lyase/cysteine desulfurase
MVIRAWVSNHSLTDKQTEIPYSNVHSGVGSGATAAIDVAVRLLPEPFMPLAYGSRETEHSKRPAVIIGPYEHHSNILPWRESNADVFELSMDKDSAVINMTELRDGESVVI